MRRSFSRAVLTIGIIVLTLAVAIAVGVYLLLKRADPLLENAEGCVVKTPKGELDLDIEQARIAATIAAVGERRRLPEQAIVIAYATAIQESKMYNVSYGDRDSLGVFQQRPSQGWGKKKQIMDPIYSTNRFFAALVKVKGYQKMPVAEAAQAVQRSAAGYAYGPHENNARILAAAFTGRVPRALHCTYPVKETPPPPRTEEAQRDLARALGAVSVPSARRGWLIATWSVAHAQQYGLRSVGFNGIIWSADGWKTGGKAGSRRVELS
ncbi:hypothetical protein [Nonomuraea africana]|uniref:Heavy metal transporter n=1 Tax=Nonomuraea africana TaxID=46171 RepID=A0ABR9KMT3_9ACTN|nr:hypothetical protein [Nonomuraea africana]MBE1563324.1 hypothetical protein [Nonomuraea africana]